MMGFNRVKYICLVLFAFLGTAVFFPAGQKAKAKPLAASASATIVKPTQIEWERGLLVRSYRGKWLANFSRGKVDLCSLSKARKKLTSSSFVRTAMPPRMCELALVEYH